MRKHRHIAALITGLLGAAAVVNPLALPRTTDPDSLNGTIWAANRGTHTIRGFDADTGSVVRTVNMSANSQPGDLAYAKGKLYVAEEFGTPPAIAIVDAETGTILSRILTASSSRPHHVHASAGGNLIAVGLYGTDTVAVVDTHNDTLLGPWDSNPLTTNGRVHAAVFSNDESTLYLASDASNEVIAMDPRTGSVFWRLPVPGAHEIALTHNQKLAYVTRRTANWLAVIHLHPDATRPPTGFKDVLALGLPDTLRLSANENVLTVGLRTMPAQLAVVDTRTFQFQIVNLSAAGETATIGGHQWTSPSGRYTLATFEGGTNPGIAIIDHKDGNRVVQTLSYPGRPHGVVQIHP
jgi:DNA-binding beta-propeller fold protein YncE